MNINALLAVLVLKNVMTQDEAEHVARYVHDRPQSTVLAETIADIKPLLVPVQALVPQLGPVGPVQREEEIAARTALATTPAVPSPVAPSAESDADKPVEHASVKRPHTKPTKK